MNFTGKRLMPTYLIEFLKDIYPGDIPADFGKRMVSRQLIAYIQQMYSFFGGKSVDNFGRDMLPEYLAKYLEYLINADYIEYEDDTVAYTKETPENALKYAFLNYVGGMCYKSLNLANTALFEPGAINTNNGEDLPNADRTRSNYIEVESNTQYTLKWDNNNVNLFCYDENKTLLSKIVAGTVTTPNNCKYIRFYGYTISSDTQIMLNKGSTALPYEPYFEGIRESLVTSVGDFTIPNEVQSLQGYGQSDPDDTNKYNYIDFGSMKFIREGYIEEGVWTPSPLETDISQYFDSNIIDVSSGEVTFNNEYGQAVPSSISYFIPNV